MTSVPELTDLFTRLATHLNDTSLPHRTSQDQQAESALGLSISNLNQSLNLGGNSRVRVLDTVLSLMCFKAPQVFDSVIAYSVKTIVTVLLSSIRCDVFRRPKDEILVIGSSISRRDCGDWIESCGEILEKLEGHGKLSESLLCAIVRVASSASLYRQPSIPIRDVKSVDGRNSLISKLLCHLPSATLLDNDKISLRLLIWYLDPLVLKRDVSNILQVAMRRPFLCLSKEFHESTEWRSIIISLVLSPMMFVEARVLLHRWFLLTGLASVHELLIQLVSVTLDVILRPMFWDISAELGGKLPFSNAYFPYNHHLLRNLAGPLSYDGFLHLLNETSEPVPSAKTQLYPSIKSPILKVSAVDHKSIWSLAINFPDWFYFASALLFSEKGSHNNCHKVCLLAASKVGKTHYEELPSIAAARYIAWILSPVSKSHQNRLADCLIKHSESPAFKQSRDKETFYKKKLKKLKLCEEDHTSTREYDDQSIAVWLNGFNKICTVYCCENVNSYESSERKPSGGLSLQKNVLFQRIPLGILLCCSSRLSEEGLELLLNYATTGRIFQSRETKTPGLKHIKWNSRGNKNPISWTDECNEKEVVAGAFLVFSFTDIVESMCSSLFETQEASIDFICRVKVQVGKYLIKCIKRFIQLGVDDDVVVMDLCSRLEQWRHQGRVVLELQKDVDNVIQVLNQIFAFCVS
ncbi:PREDICTED: uncharacterized protein LOC101299132 [Fragaria vesca subsp. vesca]|uniref:uncharacterized protein LOC101299132 n=1 Tax=Fragaria vesca subsp. vesca TaxID=101020 RepID=UPI0002C377D5|nr:PREDICTED: uncharacterized protein LOC101299132 [Fragaria vesca subsp. vesca]